MFFDIGTKVIWEKDNEEYVVIKHHWRGIEDDPVYEISRYNMTHYASALELREARVETPQGRIPALKNGDIVYTRGGDRWLYLENWWNIENLNYPGGGVLAKFNKDGETGWMPATYDENGFFVDGEEPIEEEEKAINALYDLMAIYRFNVPTHIFTDESEDNKIWERTVNEPIEWAEINKALRDSPYMIIDGKPYKIVKAR